jgi:hypothetical protein
MQAQAGVVGAGKQDARLGGWRCILASLGAWLVLAGLLSPAAGAEVRGGPVGWARLMTPNTPVTRHSVQDPRMVSFIRSQTSLNIEPGWYPVTPDQLDQLCAYPFIYVKELDRISAPDHLRNLGEYLRRGGFVCVDPCVNGLTPDEREDVARRYGRQFLRMIPGCSVRELPDDHEIFRCFFSVNVDDLFTPDMIRRGAIKPAQIGLRGVFLGERIIAVISISGLECGWPETPQRVPGCMKLIVNTYVYAMTH